MTTSAGSRVAKIIAFELAALSSLSLPMGDDISPSLATHLRANANSLDRSAERNRLMLEQDCRDAAIQADAAGLTENGVRPRSRRRRG